MPVQLLERVESFGGGSPARPHPKLDLRIESERLPLSCWVNDFLDWPDGGVRRGSGDPPPV